MDILNCMMSSTDLFYKHLPPLTSFIEALQKENHQVVPGDWWVALTDVVDSTIAIEAGRYKDVNTSGGLAAMALSNINKGMDFPFIFGGDGVTCLIPPSVATSAADILYDTKLKVKTFFNLDLRVAMVPIQYLYDRGYHLEVARLKVSKYYDQAIISGNGLVFAEQLLKKEQLGENFLLKAKKNPNTEADFTGFTCRWQDIPSDKGETISTIIYLRDEDHQVLLRKLLDQMYSIFGTEENFHPITAANLSQARSSDELGVEAKVHAGKGEGWKYQLRLNWIKLEAWVVSIALKYKLKIKSDIYQLDRMKDYQIAASDFKKFDGSLKMVLNCQPADRMRWQSYLETLRQDGQLYYGIHVADRSIMTCLLHSGSKKEVHFIDAADGGYALAAKQLKKQMTDST